MRYREPPAVSTGGVAAASEAGSDGVSAPDRGGGLKPSCLAERLKQPGSHGSLAGGGTVLE
ncbi:hypothetical protein Rifp1Sym_aa00160 [endosymbiont of Riftia pachyptila (vent Ph05)]|uniref:Uncharacterized protein n=1 Tax=endosymbiont of Riftia pachyptila (vent Ph05) TaxID=1048808 RepID=G2D8Z1_9GAMM|nr:hypothetical protein Rifp1Sym_aa00160 [endosymbiont of Riftia pachyptila (vent Ph05)]